MEDSSTTGVVEEAQENHIDRYGFITTDRFHRSKAVSSNLIATRRETEIERTRKWIKMMKKWDKYSASKLKSRIRKGIPDVARGFAWFKLSGGATYKSKYPNLAELDRLELDPLVLDEIDRDVTRTFPKHILFEAEGSIGQSMLRKVLMRCAAMDHEVGYCQGMGFIVGMLLTFMPDDEAFYCFQATLEDPKYNLRQMYLGSMIGVQRSLYVFGELGRRHLGRLWIHLTGEGVHPTMFATEWLMTMFTRGFSFDLAGRVWEIYLNEGYKIVYRVGLAILKNVESELLAASFEGIMAILREISASVDGEIVVQLGWTIPLTRAEIHLLENQFDDGRESKS